MHEFLERVGQQLRMMRLPSAALEDVGVFVGERGSQRTEPCGGAGVEVDAAARGSCLAA